MLSPLGNELDCLLQGNEVEIKPKSVNYGLYFKTLSSPEAMIISILYCWENIQLENLVLLTQYVLHLKIKLLACGQYRSFNLKKAFTDIQENYFVGLVGIFGFEELLIDKNLKSLMTYSHLLQKQGSMG